MSALWSDTESSCNVTVSVVNLRLDRAISKNLSKSNSFTRALLGGFTTVVEHVFELFLILFSDLVLGLKNSSKTASKTDLS
jgi:hypothetical protein